MVLLLVLNILFHCCNFRLHDGEGSVAFLPMEVSKPGTLSFYPFRGISLNCFDDLGYRDYTGKGEQNVKVIVCTADAQRRGFLGAKNRSQ